MIIYYYNPQNPLMINRICIWKKKNFEIDSKIPNLCDFHI